jgi:hypothetical protein
MHVWYTEHSRSVGVPPRKASGSRFPLQVLCWITSLWAFRYNRSRGTQIRFTLEHQ